jgi:pimeloyl-ACP methyl ester carboxylesterase
MCNSQLVPQNDTFNSSYTLTSDQIKLANLSQADVDNIEVAINFERSNWATGSVTSDEFYSVPENASNAAPGSLLKLEVFTNTTTYTLAPGLALSRFLFQSASLNNTPTPASAYVLWPYSPRTFSSLNGSIPLILWGHGNSGAFSQCAPSHYRNLDYQFSAPYTLALQGYAVVGPDYAGLGVSKYANGSSIPVQSQINPAEANDLFYAVEAAQTAFPSLSKEFVVVGHSLGGGAAWAAAERQARIPVEGYLGTIAGSPLTNSSGLAVVTGAELFMGIEVLSSIKSVFPDFNASIVATQAGLNYLELAEELQTCNSGVLEILVGAITAKPLLPLSPPGWVQDPTVQAWQSLALAGGKNISGPLLILQGTADTTVPKALTDVYVNATCDLFPNVDLEYAVFEDVGHIPVLYAGQQVWLERIESLFSKEYVPSQGCKRTSFGTSTPRPLGDYAGSFNYFLEYATNAYEKT